MIGFLLVPAEVRGCRTFVFVLVVIVTDRNPCDATGAVISTGRQLHCCPVCKWLCLVGDHC